MGLKLSLTCRILIAGLIIIPVFLSGLGLPGKKDPSKVLKEIYEEVKELGSFPGDDFISSPSSSCYKR